MGRILIVKLSPVENLDSSMIRTLALCKGFLKNGHKIDFITIPKSITHTSFEIDNEIKNNVNFISLNRNSLYDGIVEKNNSKFKELIISFLRAVYHKINIFNYTKKIAEQITLKDLPSIEYDYVIGISDPKTSFIAIEKLIYQGLKYNKYIQYWGDPLTIDITLKTVLPKFIIKKTEAKLLSSCDKVFYASPITLKVQKDLFPMYASKMKFIPTPFLKENKYPTNKNETFTIGYFGDYPSKIRNIEPLIKAVNNSGKKEEMEIKLNVVGNSDLEFENSNLVSFYSRRNIQDFEKNADLLVCLMNRTGTQIPGKLFHYSSTNKKILVILDGENNTEFIKFLEPFERFYICKNNENDILNSIKIIRNEQKQFAPIKEFSCDIISKRILE